MRVDLIPAAIPTPPYGDRTPGMHVSRIIRSIAIESKILKTEEAQSLSLIEMGGGDEEWWASLDPIAQLRVAIGMAWEEWYLPKLPDVVYQPGEMTIEGVYLTHDGESLDLVVYERHRGYVLAIHECKATYKSTKTVGNFESQWMWMAQIKSYCKAAGTTVAYVHVLFLCSDYKFPMSPSLGPDKTAPQVWRLEFTQDEIDSNWELLMGYVRHRKLQEAEDMMRDTEAA